MRIFLRYIFPILLLACVFDANATHNRAGDITYRHIAGFQYEITVKICTDNSSTVDRPFIPILWGDGSEQDSIARSWGPIPVTDFQNTSENVYIGTHTFNSAGQYELLVVDPNRNSNINNIEGSVEQVFSIKTVLVIPSSPELGFFNNSVTFFNPPKGDACANSVYFYNPLAFDPDGDSLFYELVEPTGNAGNPIIGYTDPDDWSPGNEPDLNGPITIDQNTGQLMWDEPVYGGEYNIALKISEYRQGVFVGSVVRDMQIRVVGLCDNDPPEIAEIPDTCVIAGSGISIQVETSDPNDDPVSVTAGGESFELNNSPSTFSTGTKVFSWQTICDHVRQDPYEVYITAMDISADVTLFNFTQFNVQVIAPPVENLDVTTETNDATITWDPSICENASGYKIYRKIGTSNIELDYCETGMPAGYGYTQIGTLEGWDNTLWLDEDIPFGNDICYRIVACFPDGAESIVSDEFCARIDLEVPVITKVSIGETSLVNGVDTLQWIPPLEIDTTDFTGPYHYDIFVGEGDEYPNQLVFTTSPTTILNLGLITYIHEGQNTEEIRNNYRIAFYSNDELITSSYPSSSTFLTLAPGDNQIELSWEFNVGWINDSYDIYRSENGVDYDFIDNTTNTTYLDTGLTNNKEYCYYVVARGQFDDPLVNFELINYSQRSCTQPWDQTPPCPPVLAYEGSCEEQDLTLTWNNPNLTCADDVTAYNVYFSPTLDGSFELISTVDGADNTEFDLTEGYFVGCFRITALDSLLENPFGELNQNESVYSDTICIEGCPVYELPNVITANNDNINDIFEPFPYRSIRDIDIRIYNRWGEEVFRTTDRDILWDGTHQDTEQPVSDGVYYYVCVVNQFSINGIVPKTLTGYLHLLDNQPQSGE